MVLVIMFVIVLLESLPHVPDQPLPLACKLPFLAVVSQSENC